jgi:cyclopropane fatty-acyl-phospholipid synthase-like methyltransferase
MPINIPRWLRYNLRYLGRPPWDTGISPPELTAFLDSTLPGRALDVGCGTGTNLMTMAAYGWDVVGLDIAFLSVIKARGKLRQAGIQGRVRWGNAGSRLRLGEYFDLVLDIGCYHSLSATEREAYHHNLARWLTPGGTYLLYAHWQTSPTHPHGVVEADFAQFSRILSLQWWEDSVERRPDGGGGRSATWARFTKE